MVEPQTNEKRWPVSGIPGRSPNPRVRRWGLSYDEGLSHRAWELLYAELGRVTHCHCH